MPLRYGLRQHSQAGGQRRWVKSSPSSADTGTFQAISDFEASHDFGVVVGAGVVDDHVQIELLGHFVVDPSQEAQALLKPLPWRALGDHCSGGHIQGCKQGGMGLADGVMRHPTT